MVAIEIMNYELKDAIRQFAIEEKDICWSSCLSITLTMKQFCDGESLDEINASRNMRHFLSRLNKTVFGSSFQRFDLRVNVMPVQECTERIHYHLLIEIPTYRNGTDVDRESFEMEMKECWQKTKFGYWETCIKRLDDADSLLKWSNYITKFKNNDSDQLDWENYHWN